MKKSYAELLRDPRWQKKRLEIMQRAGFACERCDSTERTLNVHHRYYERGLFPWDYPDDSLVCVCDTCHRHLDFVRVKAIRQIGLLDDIQLERVVGYARGLVMNEASVCDDDNHCQAENYDVICGIVDAFAGTSKQAMRRADVCCDHAMETGTLDLGLLRQAFALEREVRKHKTLAANLAPVSRPAETEGL